MKILDTEIEFDFHEINNLQRYEKALEKYMKELENIKQFQGKDSEGFEKLCDIVYEFFNNVVGKAEEILGSKKNYKKCLIAMGQIISEKQKSEKEINDLLDQYSIERVNR